MNLNLIWRNPVGKNLICERRKKFYMLSIIGFIFFSLLFSGCGGSSSNGDGSETAHSGLYSVDGYIQKGPFISGSTIIIQVLDDGFNPTGVTYQTTTNDDFGSFALGNYIQSRYIEIIATGFYFNEVSGALSDAAITLRAIADLSMEDRVNVNLLTTLEKNRIIHLIKNENKSFVDAREQAEKEVLGIFNIAGTDILSFNQLDLSSGNQGDAILLAISAIFQGNNSVAELSELLSKINLDIEKDGILNNSMYAATLKESSAGLVFNQIRTNLENRYASLGLTTAIPGFESYARTLAPPKIINTAPKDFTIVTSSYIPEVTVTFDQEMDKETITAAAFTLNNGPDNISGTVSYDEGQRKAVFIPSTGLSGDKTYTAWVSADVKSLSGINLGENMSWTFSIEIVPPAVVETTPGDLKILTDSYVPEISVVFSQEMDKATLTPATFTLNDGSGNISGVVSYDESLQKAAFTPSAGLSGDKTYTVSISMDVKSLYGIALREKISWDFSIEKLDLVPIQTNKIAAGNNYTLGLKSDGSVVAVGDNGNGRCNVSSWTDIVQIRAGVVHTVGLKSDGTVVAVGDVFDDIFDVSSWNDIVQISAGSGYTVGLKSDGSAVAIGHNYGGQCSVHLWTDIAQISSTFRHTVGLKADGSAVAVGRNDSDQCNVSSWTDIVQISAGYNHTVGLKFDSSVVAMGYNGYGQCDVSSWTDIVQISAGLEHTVGLKSDGSVVAVGNNDYGQCNVSSWTDIVQISAGLNHTVGLKSDGSVVVAGDNSYGQCDVSSWTGIVP
jgi:hypothetical protein